MSVTCPECGHARWELRRLEHRVLHVDVDLSHDQPVVERSVVPSTTSAIIGATCDGCGHVAGAALTGAVAEASEDVPGRR